MEIFFTRDSGHIFRVQSISLLFVDTEFTIKITTLNTCVIRAIEWVAYFHLLLYSSPSSYWFSSTPLPY